MLLGAGGCHGNGARRAVGCRHSLGDALGPAAGGDVVLEARPRGAHGPPWMVRSCDPAAAGDGADGGSEVLEEHKHLHESS